MSVLLDARLAPDMFPLSKQIQIVCDNAKMSVARLTGISAPVFEDNEKSFDEFVNRINKTMAYLEGIKPENFTGYDKRTAEFPWLPGSYLEGKDYLVNYALPNFYFHLSMAYAILRFNGVDLGKVDFLGELNWKKK